MHRLKLYAQIALLLFILSASASHAIGKTEIDPVLRKKVDSLLQVSQDKRRQIIYTYYANKYKKTELAPESNKRMDSLIYVQKQTDISNLDALSKIIDTYGFPSKKVVGHDKAERLLFYASASWMVEMYTKLKGEVRKGNLNAITLAKAYDKIQLSEGKNMLYHAGTSLGKEKRKNRTTPLDLTKTNTARAEIGLKEIKLKKNGKRKN